MCACKDLNIAALVEQEKCAELVKYKEEHVMKADVQSNLILILTETNISRQTI